MKIIKISFLAKVSISLFVIVSGMVRAEIILKDTRIREMPPGVVTTAAYMTLTNLHEQEIELVGISAGFAERVEVHEHLHKDGMMQMRKVESFVVSPGQTIEFKPGGYHLMVFGIKGRPKINESVDITLAFNNGEAITHAFSVYSHHQQHSH